MVGTLDEWGTLDPASLENVPYGVHDLIECRTGTVCRGPSAHLNVNVDPNHVVPTGDYPCDKPSQVGARCYGLVSRRCVVARTCSCNALFALRARHGYQQTPMDMALYGLGANEFRSVYMPQVVTLAWHLSPSVDQVWWQKWSREKQKQIYQSIFLDAHRFNAVKLFVKREIYCKDTPKPRGIQMYYNLATQEASAVPICSLQKALAHVWNGTISHDGIDITFASGMSAASLGQWMQHRLHYPNWIERDGENWDSSMQWGHAGPKLEMYRMFSSVLGSIMRSSVNVVGRYFSPFVTFAYRLLATVKSGHNDTSLGNSIANALVILSVMRLMGYTGSILVMGDDALVGVNEPVDLPTYVQYERQCGIYPQARLFHDWRWVSFISGIWAPADNGLYLIPKPGRLFARLFWTVSQVSPRRVNAFRRGVVLGLKPLMDGFPIVGEWLDRHDDRETKPFVPRDKYLAAWQVDGAAPVWGEVTKQWFQERYGVSSSVVVPKARSGYWSHPAIDSIIETDLADLGLRDDGFS